MPQSNVVKFIFSSRLKRKSKGVVVEKKIEKIRTRKTQMFLLLFYFSYNTKVTFTPYKDMCTQTLNLLGKSPRNDYLIANLSPSTVKKRFVNRFAFS